MENNEDEILFYDLLMEEQEQGQDAANGRSSPFLLFLEKTRYFEIIF